MKGFLKPVDIIILCLAVTAVFFSAGFPKKQAETLFLEVEAPAEAEGGRRYKAVYPLSEDRRFTVQGAEGVMEIAVKDGEASVVSAPCRNQLCRYSPPIGRPDEWTACIPGKVIIRITGQNGGSRSGQKTPDAVSY